MSAQSEPRGRFAFLFAHRTRGVHDEMRERTRKIQVSVTPNADPELSFPRRGEAPPQLQDWNSIFGRTAPLILEIGTGNGIFLSEEAARHPENNYIGIERSKEFFLKCKRRIVEGKLTNVRVLMVDVMDVLPIFPEKGLAKIFCLFSDPWPKRRHAARRVFNPNFFPVIERLLTPGGELIYKSDVGWYYNLTVNQLRRRAGWEFVERGPFERPANPEERAVTNFERKARESGVRCWGFVAKWDQV